jgi:hypothetical protein
LNSSAIYISSGRISKSRKMESGFDPNDIFNFQDHFDPGELNMRHNPEPLPGGAQPSQTPTLEFISNLRQVQGSDVLTNCRLFSHPQNGLILLTGSGDYYRLDGWHLSATYGGYWQITNPNGYQFLINQD